MEDVCLNYELDLDPDAVCRICLTPAPHLSNVFASSIVDGYVIALPEMLTECLDILVSPSDELPNKICAECKTQTTNFYSFKSMSKRVENVLSATLKKTPPIDLTFETSLSGIINNPSESANLPDQSFTDEMSSLVDVNNEPLDIVAELTNTVLQQLDENETTQDSEQDDMSVVETIIQSAKVEPNAMTTNYDDSISIQEDNVIYMKEEATDSVDSTYLSDHLKAENYENDVLFESLHEDGNQLDEDDDSSSYTDIVAFIDEEEGPALSQNKEDCCETNELKSELYLCTFTNCQAHFSNEVDLETHSSYHTEADNVDIFPDIVVHDDKSIYPMKAQTNKSDFSSKNIGQTRQSTLYPCEICDRKFKVLSEFKHHNRMHVAISTVSPYVMTFICKICNRGMESREALDIHVCRPIIKFSDNDDDFSCFDYQYLEDELDDRHIKCYECNATCRSELDFKEHLLRHHFTQFECPFEGCGCTYTALVHLSQHMNNKHNTDKGLECPHCLDGVLFANKHELTQHYKDCPSKLVNCSHCDKRFFTVTALTLHLAGITEKKNICDVCGKAFAQVGELKMHTRIHTREKPFVCTVCGNSFTTASMRTSHMETHIIGKTFKCEICHKMLQTKGSWRNHTRRHRENNKHNCNNCSRRFSSKFALKTHVEKIHLNKNSEMQAIQSITLSEPSMLEPCGTIMHEQENYQYYVLDLEDN